MRAGQGPFVPSSLWHYFGNRADCQALLTKVQALPLFGDAQLVDGLAMSGLQVAYEDGADIAIWLISSPTQPQLLEWAGYLVDRMTQPSPVDTHGQGGPDLLVRNEGGYTELYWGRA